MDIESRNQKLIPLKYRRDNSIMYFFETKSKEILEVGKKFYEETVAFLSFT